MTTFPRFAFLAAALAVAASACAANTASKPIAEFPDAAALGRIRQKPVAELRPQLSGPVLTKVWPLAGPLPVMAGTNVVTQLVPAASPPGEGVVQAEQLVAEAVRDPKRRPRLDPGLACTAREVGRYLLSERNYPPNEVMSFMAGACGALSVAIASAHVEGDVKTTEPDQVVEARFAPMLRERLVQLLGSDRPAEAVGLTMVRSGGKAVLVAMASRSRADVQPFPLEADEQRQVVIEGRLREPVQYIQGWINQSDIGVAPCIIDPSVPRPSFRAVCEMADGDDSAWIELAAARPKRVLGETFLRVVARRRGLAQLAYAGAAVEPGSVVDDSRDAGKLLVERLNQVRTGAGLRPVALAGKQSETATALAPHFFGDELGGGNGTTSDTIALGLLAGWDVGGMIRDGSFVSIVAPHTRDVARWLSSTLALPMGRMTLLAPDIETLAVGGWLLREPEALGAIVTGYRFHHGNDHGKDQRVLLSRVLSARKRMGLGAPKRLDTMDVVVSEALARVHAGEASPMDALDEVLGVAADRFHANMRGYVVEAASLDELEIPAEVVRQGTLHLEIGVTHHRPKGAAWAQFVILVVYIDYGDQVASRDRVGTRVLR